MTVVGLAEQRVDRFGVQYQGMPEISMTGRVFATEQLLDEVAAAASN